MLKPIETGRARTTNSGYTVPGQAAEVARLIAEHPMADAVLDQVDGRMIRVGGQWLADFASCNYLGLDLDPEVLAGVPEYLARWGSHPSWARGIASPALYEQVEAELVELLGVEDALCLPTLTHIHNGVLPALAGEARWRGHRAPVPLGRRPPRRAAAAGAGRGAPGAVHGRVNSMTGNPPDLPAFAALAREHDALLYVDDAHGFGVIGERTGYDPSPMGARATPWSAGSASPPTTWCWPPASPRPTRRCWPSWPSRPRSSGTSR
jgi:8-amino-7-oxononanoate synthase